MNVTDYRTAKQAGIVAFYDDGLRRIRVYCHVNDFRIERINSVGRGFEMEWRSTHQALSLKADVQLALESYTGKKIPQSAIDFDI